MNLKRIFFLITPVLIILTTFLLNGSESDLISWDQLQYMTVAKNIAIGHGMTDINSNLFPCRPGYTIFLAFLNTIFDITPLRMVYINNFIFSLLTLSIFYLACTVFNKRTAIFTLLLFLTDPGIVQWGHINLDATWPLLLIFSLILLIAHGSKYNDLLFGIIAGSAVGLAFLVKEWAILFIPMPLMICFMKLSEIRRGRIIAFYLAAAIPILIWAYYVLFVVNFGIKGIWGGIDYSHSLGSIAGEKSFLQSLMNIFEYFLKGSVRYFYNPNARAGTFALNHLLLFPLVGSALLWSIWKSVRHYDRSNILLLSVILLFMPFSAIVANFEYRYQQNLLTISILYILTASLIDKTLDLIKVKKSIFFKEHPVSLWLVHGLFVLIAVFPVFTWRYLELRVSFAEWLLKGRPIEVYYLGSGVVDTLDKIVKQDETIIVCDHILTLKRDFFLFGKHSAVMELPLVSYDNIPVDHNISIGAVLACPPPGIPSIEIQAFDQKSFYNIVEKNRVVAIVIQNCMHALNPWLERHLNVTGQRDFPADGYHIFYLDRNNPIKDQSPSPVYIENCVKSRLAQIKNEDPKKFDIIVHSLFHKELESGNLKPESLMEETNTPCNSRILFVD